MGAGVLFKNYPDAAAHAKRIAQESGVSVRIFRDGNAWAVDGPVSNDASHVRHGPMQTRSETRATAEAERPQPEQINLYKISTESLRAIIAEGFSGLSNNQLIIIYNQIDSHSLTQDERQIFERKYQAIRPTGPWSPSNAFAVYAATDGQD